MREYVTVELGNVPEYFDGRERDFYRCINFATLMVACSREWTGYKEIESAKISYLDLIKLKLIGYPTGTGSFKILNPNIVTYKADNKKRYHLDTEIYKTPGINTTDVFVNKDKKWLIDDEEWMKFDELQYLRLPAGFQKWYIDKLNSDELYITAQELLDKCIAKIENKNYRYDSEMADQLPTEIKEWFIKKVESKDFVSESAQQFLDTVFKKYVMNPDEWRQNRYKWGEVVAVSDSKRLPDNIITLDRLKIVIVAEGKWGTKEFDNYYDCMKEFHITEKKLKELIKSGNKYKGNTYTTKMVVKDLPKDEVVRFTF